MSDLTTVYVACLPVRLDMRRIVDLLYPLVNPLSPMKIQDIDQRLAFVCIMAKMEKAGEFTSGFFDPNDSFSRSASAFEINLMDLLTVAAAINRNYREHENQALAMSIFVDVLLAAIYGVTAIFSTHMANCPLGSRTAVMSFIFKAKVKEIRGIEATTAEELLNISGPNPGMRDELKLPFLRTLFGGDGTDVVKAASEVALTEAFNSLELSINYPIRALAMCLVLMERGHFTIPV